MENKQTTVEWVMDAMLQMENGIFIGGRYLTLYEIRERAKSREKNQIIKAYLAGKSNRNHLENSAEIYYKETYGK
jgi:hypothetical protein